MDARFSKGGASAAHSQEEYRRHALIDLSEAIGDLQDPSELAFTAADKLGRVLGVSRIAYAAIDHDAETLHVERDWTAPGVEAIAASLHLVRA